ncbi:MAG: bifunctional methylenetetrahydrofolate dehydrogenase/methenyltetrahydrofolate cyclohydrolase FolD [Candidatus Kapabacteria bacterium]|nr:bifunctional methylenetetrahydrofolate dehydrogenase/methenyltetrahydrofolate cyclohydrolase FolD [Candidatus Kapabacteria bacterium]
MPILIDGKIVSTQIKNELKQKTESLFQDKGIIPGLALMLVGDDPASKIYVSSKEKACAEIGFKSIVKRVPADTPESDVLKQIDEWNQDSSIHGILVQAPLPKHIDSNKVIMRIRPDKDVDGFHPENMGRLVIGLPGFLSCTPAGIMELLKRYEIDTQGKHTVVLGRSNIVGKPIANLLYQKNKYANSIVTICHTGTKDFAYYTKQADILIAAMGVPELIKAEHVKEGVVIIDVGINRVEDPSNPKGYRLTGDVDFNSVYEKAQAITPVPGGVGPMTIAMLLQNTYFSAAGLVKF